MSSACSSTSTSNSLTLSLSDTSSLQRRGSSPSDSGVENDFLYFFSRDIRDLYLCFVLRQPLLYK